MLRNKNGLNGYVHYFSIDHNAIAINDTLDIHKYLMKKHGIKCLGLLKRFLLQQ